MSYNYLITTTGNISWTAGANWSATTLPAAGESVYVQNSAATINTGLTSNATLAELHIPRSFTGAVGTTTTYLLQPATLINIGAPSYSTSDPGGSSLIRLNSGTAASTITVTNTASGSSDTNGEPVKLLCNNASTVLNVLAGTVGLATLNPAETSTLATVNQTGGALNMGPGVTWTTINQAGGSMRIESAGTTITQAPGSTITLSKTGTVPTLNIGGECRLNMRPAAGTVATTLNLNDGATLDLRGNPSAVSVSTLAIAGSVTILTDPANPGHFTWTTLTREAGSQITWK